MRSTPAILLRTSKLLKRTMQKVATIRNQCQLSTQQASLIAGIVVLVFVELGG